MKMSGILYSRDELRRRMCIEWVNINYGGCCDVSWCVIRFGSFHGQEEGLIQRRFSSCKRTLSYSKLLPQHQYEVDMPPKEGITVSGDLGVW